MAHNWLPCKHVSTLTPTQGRFLYMLGTRGRFCLCKVLFDAILGLANWHRHYGVVPYPCLISHLLLAQDAAIVSSDEESREPPPPLVVNQCRARQAWAAFTSSHPLAPASGSSMPPPAAGSVNSCVLGELVHIRGLLHGALSKVDFLEASLRSSGPPAPPPHSPSTASGSSSSSDA